VRTNRREANNVAIGTNSCGDTLPEFQQNSWRIRVGVSDFQRRVDFQIPHVGELC
jgi:hypothetical protein